MGTGSGDGHGERAARPNGAQRAPPRRAARPSPGVPRRRPWRRAAGAVGGRRAPERPRRCGAGSNCGGGWRRRRRRRGPAGSWPWPPGSASSTWCCGCRCGSGTAWRPVRRGGPRRGAEGSPGDDRPRRAPWRAAGPSGRAGSVLSPGAPAATHRARPLGPGVARPLCRRAWGHPGVRGRRRDRRRTAPRCPGACRACPVSPLHRPGGALPGWRPGPGPSRLACPRPGRPWPPEPLGAPSGPAGGG